MDVAPCPSHLHLQGPRYGADIKTVVTVPAFRGDFHFHLIYGQEYRTRPPAGPAVNTLQLIPCHPEPEGVIKMQEPQECAIGTQIPAPEILGDEGQTNQYRQYDEGVWGHIGEKLEHLYVCHPYVRHFSIKSLQKTPVQLYQYLVEEEEEH